VLRPLAVDDLHQTRRKDDHHQHQRNPVGQRPQPQPERNPARGDALLVRRQAEVICVGVLRGDHEVRLQVGDVINLVRRLTLHGRVIRGLAYGVHGAGGQRSPADGRRQQPHAEDQHQFAPPQPEAGCESDEDRVDENEDQKEKKEDDRRQGVNDHRPAPGHAEERNLVEMDEEGNEHRAQQPERQGNDDSAGAAALRNAVRVSPGLVWNRRPPDLCRPRRPGRIPALEPTTSRRVKGRAFSHRPSPRSRGRHRRRA